MNINIHVTTDEQKRIKCAAKFLKLTVSEFAVDWILAGVRACEDDYIIHDGKVIGDRLEIGELEDEVFGRESVTL